LPLPKSSKPPHTTLLLSQKPFFLCYMLHYVHVLPSCLSIASLGGRCKVFNKFTPSWEDKYGFGPGFVPWVTRPDKRSLSVIVGTPNSFAARFTPMASSLQFLSLAGRLEAFLGEDTTHTLFFLRGIYKFAYRIPINLQPPISFIMQYNNAERKSYPPNDDKWPGDTIETVRHERDVEDTSLFLFTLVNFCIPYCATIGSFLRDNRYCATIGHLH
jgi:hypothetical protein